MALTDMDYLLACLSEEASEVVMSTTDVLDTSQTSASNPVESLVKEINDLHTVVLLMAEYGVLLGTDSEPVSFVQDSVLMSPETSGYAMLLNNLIKRASHMSQYVCKAQRFGLDDCCPTLQTSNRSQIVQAINAVYGAITALQQVGFLPKEIFLPEHIAAKRKRVLYWLSHAVSVGHIRQPNLVDIPA